MEKDNLQGKPFRKCNKGSYMKIFTVTTKVVAFTTFKHTQSKIVI